MKTTKEMLHDYYDYHSFCAELMDIERKVCGIKDTEQIIPMYNAMMVMSYAANVWFANKQKKEVKK